MARIKIGNFMGPEGPKGEQGPIGAVGPEGPQGPPGDVSTEQLTTVETTLDEKIDQTKESLEIKDTKIVKKVDDIAVNVKDFGAIGDGVNDDTQALNQASEHAKTLGTDKTIIIPEGRYRTTDTVSFNNSVDGSQATIRYEGTGTAIVVGDESEPGKFLNRVEVRLPRVVNRSRPDTGWDGTSVGIKCVNLNTCIVYVPFIQNFETGLFMYGYSQGCSYNTVELGALWDNHVNLLIDSDEAGWSNQTLYMGGRLQHSLNKGATENDADACQIKFASTSSNNQFVNTSIEGYNLGEYRIIIDGSYNKFTNMRFENHSEGPPKVLYKSGSVRNKIEGGYHSQTIEEVFEGTTDGGVLEDGTNPFFKGELSGSIEVANDTEWKTLTELDVQSHRASVDPATGLITLKPGMWSVEGKVTFGTSSGGSYQLRLVKGYKVIASQVMRPDSNYQFSLTTGTIEHFSPTDTLKLEYRQTSTTENLTLNGGQFTSIKAIYLGGSV